MRITSKGQVTIPQDIREAAGLLPGSEVEFRLGKDGVRILKKTGGPRSRGAKVVERLKGTADKKLSTDEILALMRGPRG